MLGNLSVIGSITATQNVYLNGVNSKIGIALGSAESSIQTAGLKTTTPTALGVHLGMDSLTGAAGVSVVATNISQSSYGLCLSRGTRERENPLQQHCSQHVVVYQFKSKNDYRYNR